MRRKIVDGGGQWALIKSGAGMSRLDKLTLSCVACSVLLVCFGPGDPGAAAPPVLQCLDGTAWDSHLASSHIP